MSATGGTGVADGDGPRVGVLRMEGTNNEQEMLQAFRLAGAAPEFVHIKQLGPHATGDRVRLTDLDVLALPGGFSAGDYVRAGAIFASRLRANAWKELEALHHDGHPILGTCNGFQVLVELGLLPGGTGDVEACLFNNASGHFECRPTFLRVEDSVCRFTRDLGDGLRLFPAAHAEGRLVLTAGLDMTALRERGQVVFTYRDAASPDAEAPYPWNPNGSELGVAGITDPTGTVLGLMPHPERAVHGWQVRGFLGGDAPDEGPGLALFRNILADAR